MTKFKAITMLALLCVTAFAQQDNGSDAIAKAAIAVARTELAKQMNIDATALEVASSMPQTWPTSALGCAKPGQQAAQVVTKGYVVIFKTPQGNKRMHATDKYAVQCDVATLLRDPKGMGAPLNALNEKIEMARADLSKRIRVPLNEVRVAEVSPMTWQDSAMECPLPGEQVIKGPNKGYKMTVRHKERRFTYHTDAKGVRPCPAIEMD